MPVLVIQLSPDKTGNLLVVYKMLFAGAEEMKTPSEEKETLFISMANSCFGQGTQCRLPCAGSVDASTLWNRLPTVHGTKNKPQWCSAMLL